MWPIGVVVVHNIDIHMWLLLRRLPLILHPHHCRGCCCGCCCGSCSNQSCCREGLWWRGPVGLVTSVLARWGRVVGIATAIQMNPVNYGHWPLYTEAIQSEHQSFVTMPSSPLILFYFQTLFKAGFEYQLTTPGIFTNSLKNPTHINITHSQGNNR